MTDSSTPNAGESLLDALAKRTGRSTRIHLRDAAEGDSDPIVDPRARELQAELSGPDQGKYRILGEIARGGMGVVLRGHDVELGRDVAIKVVDGRLAERADVVDRFVEEAQIGGQLQHPGIVPVYELGLMADERPYFTMKLVKGRTLAEMLSRRESVEAERVRFLRIFESVCQTMAYAHSKGVIHRDLKPANIMVGAFGEVQVVDWGLSKVLRRGGVDDELEARDRAQSIIETVRSGPASGSDSLVGNVLGTPDYMSPEQAQGEIDQLDERTDVFALGGILCELLTGQPPYVPKEDENRVELAAMAALDDAKARLDQCTAAPELVDLCRRCLLPSRAARIRDAERVAAVVHDHLEGLETRAHEESLRAERSRRYTQLALLATVIVALVAGGWWWTEREARARETELRAEFDQVQSEVLSLQRAGEYGRAIETARSGLRLLETGAANAPLRAQAEEAIAASERLLAEEEARARKEARDQELLAELDELRMQMMSIINSPGMDDLPRRFERVFRELGYDLTDPELGDRITALRGTPRGLRLAKGFDAWALLLRALAADRLAANHPVRDEEQHAIDLVTAIGLDLDPDPTRAAIRLAKVERDVEALVRIAEEQPLTKLEADTLFALGAALGELRQGPLASRVITIGADRYPHDFDLVSVASFVHEEGQLYGLSARYARAAVSLRPDLPGIQFRLAERLDAVGDVAGAVLAFERVRELDPSREIRLWRLGMLYLMLGEDEKAIAVLDEELARAEEKAARVGGRPSFLVRVLPLVARVSAGRTSVDELLAWIDADPHDPADKWLYAAQLLAPFPPLEQDPQPLLALELLEPHRDARHRDAWTFWTTLGAAYALLGDGLSAIDAARRLERLDLHNDWTRTYAQLLRAAGERLAGDAAAASEHLRRFQRGWVELRRADPELGKGGWLERANRWLEPIARGD